MSDDRERMPAAPAALAKRAFRKQFTAKLRAIPPNVIVRESEQVTRHVLALPEFQASSSVSIYLSTPHSEVQTDVIVIAALEQKKRVYIPYCPREEPQVMRMLLLKDRATFDALSPNKWSIREFSSAQASATHDAQDSSASRGLDLILVPGLAFDGHGDRLGHGRGYYDRYLELCNETSIEKFGKPPPKTVALSLSEQLLRDGLRVPTESWDRRPDLIVTPDGILTASVNE